MTLEAICICTVTRMLHGCPRHAPGEAATPQSTHAMLIRIIENQEKIMAAQDDINNAVTVFTGILNDLQAQTSQLVTDLANLQALIASGQPADTSALNSLVSTAQGMSTALDTAVSNVTALAPGAPAAGTAGSTAPAEGAPASGDTGSAS